MACNTLVFLTLVLALGSVNGEVIRTSKCHISAGEMPKCAIHEVRVTPCRQAEANNPCRLKLGSNATLEFDYTPTWGTTKAKSWAYKIGGMGLVDIGFMDMDQDGCKYTTCPIEAGKKQHYRYHLNIASQFPPITHQVKWTLWNDENWKEKCCFKFSLELYN